MLYPTLITLAVLQLSAAQQVHYFEPLHELEQVTSEKWAKKYGKQFDQTFSGPLSFSHLTYARCLEDRATPFDIAILGMPFDTAVTYRPGARFGPFAIRSGSRRQRELRGYTLPWGMDPFAQGVKVVDCGDVSLVDSRANAMPCRLLLAFYTGTGLSVRQCSSGGSNAGSIPNTVVASCSKRFGTHKRRFEVLRSGW